MFFHQQWSKNFRLFGLLLKIQTVYWFTNYVNLVMSLGVSLFIMVCWLAFKTGDPFLLVSGISVGVLRNAMIVYSTNLLEWKAAGTNEKLIMTPISKTLLVSSIIIFNFLTTLGIALIMLIVTIAFFPPQRELIHNANWLIVLTGFLLVWLTSVGLGLFCYEFIKNLVYSRMAMILVYTLSVYLLGLGFPLETIFSPTNAWLGYILYFFPHRFAMNLMQAGFANWHGLSGTESILRIKEMPIYDNDQVVIRTINIDFGYNGYLWLAYLLAIVVLIVYFGLAIGKLSYGASFHRRNAYGELVVSQKSSRYIHSLKQAKDLQQVQLLHKARIEEIQGRIPELKQIINQVQHETKLLEKIKNKKNKSKS